MGMRFYKRIGGKAGLNLSKSGLSASFRTRGGSIGTRGYSLRTGISGLFFRGSWGKGSRRSGGAGGSFGCLAGLIRLSLIIFALGIIIALLPAIIGAAVIYFIYRAAEWFAKANPLYAMRIRIAGFALDALVIIGVVVTYYYLDLNSSSNGASPNHIVAQAETQSSETAGVRIPNARSGVTHSVTGAVEATSSTLEIFSCEIVVGSQVLITEETLLYLSSTTNNPPSDNSAPMKLSCGTVVVVDDISSLDDWYFIRAYSVSQKSIFDSNWDELGRGWIESIKCQETATLFAQPFDSNFLPVWAKELKEAIDRAHYESGQKYPDSNYFENHSNFIDTALYKYKKRISLPDPKIDNVSYEKQNGQYICKGRCSDLTFVFPVSDSVANALKYHVKLNFKRVLRIEGVVTSLYDYDPNLHICDVIIIANIVFDEPIGK